MSEQATQPEKPKPISPAEAIHASRELLDYFEVGADPVTQTDEFVEAMRQLDPRYKEDRTLVRYELEEDKEQWPAEVKDMAIDTAIRLRMLEDLSDPAAEGPIETPLNGDYDVVISLGAARQAKLDGLRYAAEAIHEGQATSNKLVIVGSARPLKEDEQKNVANYAPGATTEFDLCVGAAEAIAEEFPEFDVEAILLDKEKAGTPNVVEKVLATLQGRGELPEGTRVAAVTTQIYQTSTSFDVARVAEQFGITDTFVAGNPSDPEIVAKRKPATYLSEILRTLKAAALAGPKREELERLEKEQRQAGKAADEAEGRQDA